MKRLQTASTLHRPIFKAQALYEAGRFREALEQAEKVARIHGHQSETYYWRAAALLGLQNSKRAAEVISEALKKYPEHARLLALGGAIAMRNGLHGESRELLERSIEVDPGMINGWVNYAALMAELREHTAARDACLKALAINPNEPTAACNYATSLKELGEMDAAMEALRKAVQLAPRDAAIRANLLFVMLFDQDTTALDLLREAQIYGDLVSGAPHAQRAPTVRQDGGPIRLGLLSNDLLRHACAYFILPLLANLDRTRVEVVALSLNPVTDHITEKFRLHSSRFVELAGKPKTEIVKLIREEQLDVLMDLGGHTGTSPLQYMGHALAPVQMTWLGYPGSTGMQSIHFRVSDWTCDPAGYESHYTETLLRTPGTSYVYAPLVQDPLAVYSAKYQVQETPALRNGFITFGSCNNLGKITSKTLRLWSTVLERCPGSRLLIEAREMDRESVRAPFLARVAQAGIDPARIICVPRASANQYLTYNDIDIALDTSPLTGGTTTCDALWMGVPVVSLAGQAYHARISATFLHAVGLDGLICQDEDEYVAAATQLASDIGQLNALRLSLRQRFEQGPAGDGAGFARWLETQLTDLVSKQRQLDVPAVPQLDGMYFSGEWHTMTEIVLAIGGLLEAKRYDELRGMLENFAAKWSKHWMIPFVLSEIDYRSGNKEASVALLMESVGLRSYHLPLYRLLSARLDECAYDKGVLADFLNQQFGMSLAYLDQQTVPTAIEILGIEIVPAPGQETAELPEQEAA